ncbi:hypothetical protein HYPSUDRAFT_198045 [Hypholoma sublateritium FD-334 SS-4]|uniref:Uncharacterized protein n=1 Tax=Hypholoma sublateritium (strain FD-334 SS-4) TaxID=945553 RepID=A0A0D2Q850_HYPSF|nr:hypothetical protein HYPSUDRAFT_198045 [Hypholoma sublateritium FD-334 SS-4]
MLSCRRCNALTSGYDYQGRYAQQVQSGSKRRGSEDAENKPPPKKRRLGSGDVADMAWLREEITGIREGVEKIVAEAREGREALNSALQELLHEVQQSSGREYSSLCASLGAKTVVRASGANTERLLARSVYCDLSSALDCEANDEFCAPSYLWQRFLHAQYAYSPDLGQRRTRSSPPTSLPFKKSNHAKIRYARAENHEREGNAPLLAAVKSVGPS